jgi:hypothetical protein
MNIFRFFSELASLKNEVRDLRTSLEKLTIKTDPYSNIPLYDLGILDRHNIARQIFRDEIQRPNYAFGIWLATIQAAKLGITKLSIVEFGVAGGEGLLNLCDICSKFSASTDIKFDIFGFDSEIGMPPLLDFRDHPEIWQEGQFFSDHNLIRGKLPANATLFSGNIKSTLPNFIRNHLTPSSPLGFVSIDVDLYSSAKDCFHVFEKENPLCYLPTSIVYIDDINDLLTLNNYAGEALAISEFNLNNKTRKLDMMAIRQNHPPRGWHDHIYGLHVLDHPIRSGNFLKGGLHNINITAM